MLPSAGVYYFPWEINSSVPEGETLRTFGKLCSYNLAQSEAVLTAQHSSAQYQVCVNTEFVEPFQAQLGSRYLVVGEVEHREDFVIKKHLSSITELVKPVLKPAGIIARQRIVFTPNVTDRFLPYLIASWLGEGPVVKARILTCVEGMNVLLLEQAVQEQRKYFSERQERMGNNTS